MSEYAFVFYKGTLYKATYVSETYEKIAIDLNEHKSEYEVDSHSFKMNDPRIVVIREADLRADLLNKLTR